MWHYLEEHHKGSFTPEEVEVLVAAFNKALASLVASGIQLDGYAAAIREALAKRIIENAKQGELHPQRLTEDALDHVTVTLLAERRETDGRAATK